MNEENRLKDRFFRFIRQRLSAFAGTALIVSLCLFAIFPISNKACAESPETEALNREVLRRIESYTPPPMFGMPDDGRFSRPVPENLLSTPVTYDHGELPPTTENVKTAPLPPEIPEKKKRAALSSAPVLPPPRKPVAAASARPEPRRPLPLSSSGMPAVPPGPVAQEPLEAPLIQTAPIQTAPPVPEPEDDADRNAATRLTLVYEPQEQNLTQDHRERLKLLLGMAAASEINIEIKAYASPDGENQSSARRISLSRALAVREFLIESGGIDAGQIFVRAMGDETQDPPLDRVDLSVTAP